MRKRLLALIVILALVLSLSACKKEDKPKDEGAGTEQEENEGSDTEAEDEGEDTTDESGAAAQVAFTLDTEYAEEDNAEFAEFVNKQYISSIESSYLTMHVYYQDPEAAGINMDNVEVSFGTADTAESLAEDRAYYTDLMNELKRFDRASLSRSQQDEYDSLFWEISTMLRMRDEKFDFYDQLFAPPNSLDQNIVSWISSWEVRNEREVQEFIQLLESLPAYVDSSIEYAKVQQEKELFMTDFDKVIENCDDVISIGMDSEVIDVALSHIDNIEGLDDAKKAEYRESVSKAFEECYLPIFVSIRDAMESMKGGYNNTEGLATFPNGAEYFQVLLNYAVGLLDTPCDEISAEMTDLFQAHLEGFTDILDGENGEQIIAAYLGEGTSTGYADYKAILDDIKEKMLVDHPEVKHLEYEIKNASEEEKLDEKNVAAYFLIPPVDGDRIQRMRVNPSNKEIESLSTYTTVTHEGFPGHMYQYAYIYDNIKSDYIKTLGVDGNVEGYAVYSQYGSLDYIDDEVIRGVGQINSIDDKAGYLIYELADIGINYEGWSMDDTSAFFEESGIPLDEETLKEVYDYLRCAPATYAPYGYGYEQIALLRRAAEVQLGDKFSSIEFNRALLDAGPTPYNVVTRHIGEYVLGQ